MKLHPKVLAPIVRLCVPQLAASHALSIAVLFLVSSHAVATANEAEKVTSIADSVASLDELNFLAATFGGANQAGFDKAAVENAFLEAAQRNGANFEKAEGTGDPFFVLSVSTLVSNGGIVTLDVDLYLQEWSEFERDGERYQTLARTWTTGHLSSGAVADAEALGRMLGESFRVVCEAVKDAQKSGSPLGN